MVVHLSSDLMMVGKVSSWAKTNGKEYKSLGTVDKLLTFLESQAPASVLIDLQNRSLNAETDLQRIRAAYSTEHLYGYAQHVIVELIEAAKTAGFDRVLTRGQFDRGFAELFV